MNRGFRKMVGPAWDELSGDGENGIAAGSVKHPSRAVRKPKSHYPKHGPDEDPRPKRNGRLRDFRTVYFP